MHRKRWIVIVLGGALAALLVRGPRRNHHALAPATTRAQLEMRAPLPVAQPTTPAQTASGPDAPELAPWQVRAETSPPIPEGEVAPWQIYDRPPDPPPPPPAPPVAPPL